MSEQQPPAKPGLSRYVIWGFAALGVAAACSVVFLAVLVMGVMPERRPEAKVAGKAAAEQFSVQNVDAVRGTDLLRIEIGIGTAGRDSYSSGSYSSGGVDQRNLILLDRRTGASRRLLPDNSRHVERSWFFPAVADDPAENQAAREADVTGEPAAKQAPPPPFAYYALTVRQAAGRGVDLLVGDLASGRQGFVFSGLDGIDRIWMLSPTRLAVLMRDKLQLHYRVIDIPTLKVVIARPVDIG